MHSNPSKRIYIVSAGMVFLMLLLVVKLFFVQIVHGNNYTERADRQYLAPSGTIYDRGSIYFTTKGGQLVSGATLAGGFKIALVPRSITDAESLYAKIAPILPAIDHAEFMVKATKRNDPYEEIAVHAPKETADAISALKEKGIVSYKEKWRYYPGGSLAARTLGFVAYKGDTLGGRYGLERQYDDVLIRSAADADMNFFAEVFSNLGNTLFHSNQEEGDIVTTIEPSVQAHLETVLGDIEDAYHSDESGAIVIDPNTGEILAMAAAPGFDLNEFQKVKDPLTYANPLVENVYEVGSVMKTLTMAAGLDAGVITPETTYNDKGFVILNKKQINNHDKKAHGITPMQEVIDNSLNVGAVFIMQKLGQDRFRDYFLKFGLDEKSGIDMPGEINSLVGNLHSAYEVDYATASFGQGIALVPAQAVRAFSALANGGTLITPHLVKEIRYLNGNVEPKIYPVKEGIIKKTTSEAVTKMLVGAVDHALLGGELKLDRYSVAAKTGTAQMAKSDGTGYYEDRFMHTMYGYYPAYDPKFLVFMYNTNPKGVSFASNTMGKHFMNMAEFLLSYYDVPPDR